MQQQGQLWQLLMDFQDCFSIDEGDLGQTSLVQHDIDTGVCPYMLVAKTNAESPLAFQVVMVPKNGGEWRFCIDYRRLNARKDSYPIPLVDECLDLVACSCHWT